jgi:hypothetical protein
MAENWDAVPLVFVRFALCPKCRHDRYVKSRTENNLDGSFTKKCVCRRCSQKFLIVTEPVSGKDTIWPC